MVIRSTLVIAAQLPSSGPSGGRRDWPQGAHIQMSTNLLYTFDPLTCRS